jgi:UDP:flavonoid glycosyltransferase YjiC (YdhE family)
MARILILASGMVSGLNVSAELAARLVADGHEVTLATTERHRDRVADLGLTYRPFPEVNLWAFRSGAPGMGKSPFSRGPAKRRARAEGVMADHGVAETSALLAELSPDLAIIDFELHGAILTALAEGTNLALLQYFFSTFPGPENPPLGDDAVPGQGDAGAPARISAHWRKFMWWKRAKAALYAYRDWGGDLPTALKHYAQTLGVSADVFDRNRWQYPWGYHLPYLMTSPAELDFAGGHGNLRFVGALVPKTPASSALDGLSRAPGQKLILAAFGTVDAPPAEMVARLWAAMGARPDWRLVHALPKDAPRPEGAPPANVTCTDWIDQRAALGEVDLLIHHGGVASVREAAHAGVPQIVIPRGMMDRPGGAARVVFHGIGGRLEADAPADAMTTEIARLLDDGDVAARCARMAEASKRYGTEKVAEAEVRRLLGLAAT